jgi:hypothetical protein
MSSETISWSEQSRFKSNAEDAARIIRKAQQKHPDQICQAKAVVNGARSARSPIHDDFEWDDAVAAEAHRVERARKMIRSLVVVIEEGNPEPLFCNVRIGEQRGYMPTRAALSRQDSREALLADAKADAQRFREKYKHLVELSEVVRAIDQMIAA